VAVFTTSSAPIPIYERDRGADGLSIGDLSIAAVSWFVAIMLALVVFGRLSDHPGRRPVSIIAVVLAAAECLSLLDVTSRAVLVPGRILRGLPSGLGFTPSCTRLRPPRH
jgi:MFS family permease